MGALIRKVPLEPEVTFMPPHRVRRNNRHEKRAVVQLTPNPLIPGVPTAQLALIEIPMLAFKIWPKQTPITIDKAKAAASRHGRQYAIRGLEIIAALLVVRGVIGLA